MRRDVTLLSSLTLSKAEGQRRRRRSKTRTATSRRRRTSTTSTRTSALGAYHQPYNSTTSFVVALPFGHGKRWGGSPGARRPRRRLAARRHQHGHPGRDGHVHLRAGPRVPGVGDPQDFRGANNYRPNVTCDPYAPAGQQAITNWFNRAASVPTDPSQPFGNAPRNNVRGPNFWSSISPRQTGALAGSSALEFRLEAFNLFDRANFTAPNGNRSAAGFGTITTTYDPRQLQLGLKVIW